MSTEELQKKEELAREMNQMILFKSGMNYYNGTENFQKDQKKALEIFEEVGEQGLVTAMENAGVMYRNGYEGGSRDLGKAIVWFEKAIRCGSEKAFYNLKELYQEKYGSLADEKLFEICKEIAEEGYYLGMVQIHRAYLNGKGTEKNEQEAMRWLEIAADGGFAEACQLKGQYLFEGENGYAQDREAAVKLWETAEEKGDMAAAYGIGLYYLYCCEPAEEMRAFEKFKKIRATGISIADRELKEFYAQWKKYNIDPQEAFLFFKACAEKNEHDSEAQFQLGIAYEFGYGTEIDDDLACACYKKAADDGRIDAALFYGMKEAAGNNPDLGMQYLNKAAENGNPATKYQIAEFYWSGVFLPEDKVKAIKLFEEAAEQGHASAQLQLGLCYINGEAVDKSATKAVYWFEKAAEQGEEAAQVNLGLIYLDGDDEIVIDKTKALQWFAKASEKGNAQAKCNLAKMYEQGDGVAINLEKAEQLYKEAIRTEDDKLCDGAKFQLACLYSDFMNRDAEANILWRELAEKGNASAQYNLALAYVKGTGIEKDYGLARIWFEQAAQQGMQAAEDAIKTLDNIKKEEAAKQYTQSSGNTSSSSGGCYVATCAYGSYDCPEVWTLRRFRDYTLAETWYGRLFIHTYYAISPTIVKWFGNTNWFKKLCRGKLDKLVKNLNEAGVANTKYEDKEF